MTKEKRILISSSLFHALNDAATVAVPMIFPLLYSQKLIIRSYSQIGILSNLGLLVTFIFQILIVQASKRVDYKRLLCLSFLGISVTLLLISGAARFATLLFLYLLFRVFDSFYHTLGLAWVARSHPSRGIDLAMGVQSGSGNFGVFLAFISVGYLAQRFGWRIPLQTWSGVCLALGLISFFLVRRISFVTKDLPSFDWTSWRETVCRIRGYVAGFAFGGACWSTTVYFAPSLLHHRFHIPLGKTGIYMALWIGLGTFMTYLFGALSHKLGRSRVYKLGFGGASFSLLILGAAPKQALAVVGLFLFGTFLFLIYPALQSYVGNAVPFRNHAQAFSVVSNIQMISGALASLVAGFLSDRFGISSPFLFMGCLGAAATLFYGLPRLSAPNSNA